MASKLITFAILALFLCSQVNAGVKRNQKTLDPCTGLTMAERAMMSECAFQPNVLVECAGLNENELGVMGDKCSMGGKILIQAVDCGSLSSHQRTVLGAKCNIQPQLLVECGSLGASEIHALGAKCSIGGKILAKERVSCGSLNAQEKLALGAKCALNTNTILAKVNCGDLSEEQLASLGDKCAFTDSSDNKILAESVDCNDLSEDERVSLSDECSFTNTNTEQSTTGAKILIKSVDCGSLSTNELSALGDKCAMGNKVLAKEVDCNALTSNERQALGEKCSFTQSKILAKQVSCQDASHIASVNAKCALGDKILAKSIDCRLLAANERVALGDKCAFSAVNKVLAKTVDCTSLNYDQLRTMGAKCSIGRKVLARQVQCESLTKLQQKAMANSCQFKPQVLVACNDVVGSHHLGEKCSMGATVLVECENSLENRAHCELSQKTIALVEQNGATLDPCAEEAVYGDKVDVDCAFTNTSGSQ